MLLFVGFVEVVSKSSFRGRNVFEIRSYVQVMTICRQRLKQHILLQLDQNIDQKDELPLQIYC